MSSSSGLLGSSRWDAAPSRSGAGARTASEKRPSARNGSLPQPIKGAAAADRGADNPVRRLPLFPAAQQSRSPSRFGGSRDGDRTRRGGWSRESVQGGAAEAAAEP